MILKISLPILFLFVTIISAKEAVTKEEPFSIEKVWKESAGQSHKHKPDWIKGVQKYYDDVLLSFGSFPSELSDQADLVKTTLQTLMSKAVQYSNSNSTIISTGATKILEVFSEVKLDDHTAQGVINEFFRVLPYLMTVYRGIVTDLTNVIGDELVNAVNEAITDAEGALTAYVIEFNEGDGNGLKKEVDYEPVMKRTQTLINTISLMGEVTLTESQLATPEVHDALIVLSMVLEHILICVHGLSSSSEAVLLQQKSVLVALHVCSRTVYMFMSQLTESLATNTKNTPAHLRNVADLTRKLNSSLKKHFGIVNDATLNVEKITRQLSKCSKRTNRSE